MSKKIFMVEINASDDGDDGRKDVSGVEPAAEADFEDRELNALASKAFKRHGSDAFEIGGMGAEFAGGQELLDEDMDARKSLGEGFVADFFAVDTNALVDSFQVGRSI